MNNKISPQNSYILNMPGWSIRETQVKLMKSYLAEKLKDYETENN